MIREKSLKQLNLGEFITPNGRGLRDDNRWVKLAKVVPWSELTAAYNLVMNADIGRPGKPARLVIGAMIIKHKLNYSDEETVLQIQENQYLQYFCGLDVYEDKPPFAPSLFVDIRKRMSTEMFAAFEQGVVNQSAKIEAVKNSDDEPPTGSGTGGGEGATTHSGKLLMDATVADQMIRFPTDFGLLNEAREISEHLIDKLHEQVGGKKVRTYRIRARKDYLAVSKRKKAGSKLIRKGIRKQLQYVKRNLKYISGMLDTLMPSHACRAFPLQHRLQRQYWIIQVLYEQQQGMYDSNTRRCADRIISISQPYVRPIVRGKAGSAVEFGSKISVSMIGKLAFVDHLSWNAFNESTDLIAHVENYKQRFGVYPESVHADGVYGTRDNRQWLKEKKIHFAGKALGRPRKQTPENANELKQIRKQRRLDERIRIPIEGKFGQGKNGYRLNQIRARLASTAEAWVRCIFLVMNLVALAKFLLPKIQTDLFQSISTWMQECCIKHRWLLPHLKGGISFKYSICA